MNFSSIEDIKRLNVRTGHYFFDRGTLRYFGSRILPTIYAGCYFITSEDNFDRSKKQYTIRRANDDGSIDTINVDGTDGPETGFNRFDSLKEAKKALNQYLKTQEA